MLRLGCALEDTANYALRADLILSLVLRRFAMSPAPTCVDGR